MIGPDEEWLVQSGKILPAVNVAEADGAFEVTVDLPGLKPEDVHVEVKNDRLWITGERKEEEEKKEKNYRHIERRFGRFERVVPLPIPVDADQVEAGYKDGVLTVHVPKLEEAKAKRIPVKS